MIPIQIGIQKKRYYEFFIQSWDFQNGLIEAIDGRIKWNGLKLFKIWRLNTIRVFGPKKENNKHFSDLFFVMNKKNIYSRVPQFSRKAFHIHANPWHLIGLNFNRWTTKFFAQPATENFRSHATYKFKLPQVFLDTFLNNENRIL